MMNINDMINNNAGFTFEQKKFELALLDTFDIQRIDDEDFIRTYLTPNGDRYASVTSMLGLTKNDDFLGRWENKLGNNYNFWHELRTGEKISKEDLKDIAHKIGRDIAERSSTRGNYMHDTLEQYTLGNKLDYRADKAFLVENLAPLLNEKLGKIHLVEGQLWSDTLELAGTLDLCAYWDNQLSIIDYKNSLKPRTDKFNQDYYVQSCIYATMVYERYGLMPQKIVILVSINNPLSNVRKQEFTVNVKDILPKLKKRIIEFRGTDVYKLLKEKTSE